MSVELEAEMRAVACPVFSVVQEGKKKGMKEGRKERGRKQGEREGEGKERRVGGRKEGSYIKYHAWSASWRSHLRVSPGFRRLRGICNLEE